MDNLSLEQKQQQFNEFFTIKHPLKVNLQCLEHDYPLPTNDEELQACMPTPFKISSELTVIETHALKPLRHLGEQATQLVEFLKLQSHKIDLIMSMVLQMQDDAEQQYQGIEFGGSGIKIVSDKAMTIGQLAELKLFLTEEAAAVYCFGEVIACHEENDQYHISLIFNQIREQDQDLLVRASLHIQTQQLKKRRQN
ncbi:PilZ domain-containing protein [Neptunicella marina]|uniref:PilZ domain-containing protein n=1 Tax=Neptunicella marina TaxID=2125989 RepID=A0A8J6M6A0_9ALTE|nr:PilZ domain-containing protein [Neptunicella marina]MBC3767016.1 PilZ domain-containing protein [Neptunicella marina]